MAHAITKIYPFNTAANYVFDDAELNNGKCQLSLVSQNGQTFSEDFTNDTGFTYDAAKAEFASGQVQQKDEFPDTMFYANYATTIDGDRTLGSPTGVAVGGAKTAAGQLDLSKNDIRYVDYDADLNADSQQTGCIRFKVTPNYDGTPASNQNFAAICQGVNLFKNLIRVYHSVGGSLIVNIFDSSPTLKVTIAAAWAPVRNQEYEVELNYSSGSTRLFLDGVLQSTENTTVFTRDTDIELFRVGANYPASPADESNFKINDFAIFSSVQHTANYTIGTFPTVLIYQTNTVELPAFTLAGPGAIQALETFTTTEGGSPRYVINNGTIDMYWDGAAWVASTGVYAQANTVSDVHSNIVAYPILGLTTLTVKALFTESDTQSSVDQLDVSHESTVYPVEGSVVAIEGLHAHGVSAFAATVVNTANTSVRYALWINGGLQYWSGSAWVASDGSAAETNTAADIHANVGSLTLPSHTILVFYALLETTDQSETPLLDEVSITYAPDDEVGLPVCNVVWGNLAHIGCSREANADVTFTRVNGGVADNNRNIISNEEITTSVDSNGNFNQALVPGQYYVVFTGTDTTDTWTMNKNASGGKLTITVPTADTSNIVDIID